MVYGVVWSPDGRWLASVSRDQTLRVWDLEAKMCRWVGRTHTSPINEVVWSPDGRRLASCGEDHTLRLWRAEDGTLLQTLIGHASSVAGVAWSPDGQLLASCVGGVKLEKSCFGMRKVVNRCARWWGMEAWCFGWRGAGTASCCLAAVSVESFTGGMWQAELVYRRGRATKVGFARSASAPTARRSPAVAKMAPFTSGTCRALW
jgi:hypothetical protein